MSAGQRVWRDAVVLPWLLMAVALLSSLRVTMGGELRVVPPALSALVLMLPFIAVLVRSGLLAPVRLFGEPRSGLATTSAVVLLVALAWATAGVLALVTPEAGLPRLAGLVLLTALLFNTLAADAGRVAALRALSVACLAGFVAKFILLDAVFDPSRGLGGRIVTAVLEGATLGGFSHTPWAPLTGYLAFLTLVLFFVAIWMLPSVDGPRHGTLTAPGSQTLVADDAAE